MELLQNMGIFPKHRPILPKFHYLQEDGPIAKYEDLIVLRDGFLEMIGLEMKGDQEIQGVSDLMFVHNLTHTDPDIIQAIYKRYGEHGLAKFQLLCSTQDKREFKHFYDMIKSDIMVGAMFTKIAEHKIEYDNHLLSASPKIDALCHNVVNIPLSRKLYNPGNYQHGTLAYGLGGSRVLISLPFKGLNFYHYDVYNNTTDVISSLMLQGYLGTFLALDRNDSLNDEYFGLPGWLVWFSFIATHSDLIIFIKEKGKDLTESQKQEASLSPDRVPKKIVEIEELTWAKAEVLKEEEISLPQMYAIPGKGEVSEEEFKAKEREFAESFINIYDRGSFPKDRLILIHEDGKITEEPLVNLA